jgi:hypothetical protein
MMTRTWSFHRAIITVTWTGKQGHSRVYCIDSDHRWRMLPRGQGCQCAMLVCSIGREAWYRFHSTATEE